jgi:hypothetical protein
MSMRQASNVTTVPAARDTIEEPLVLGLLVLVVVVVVSVVLGMLPQLSAHVIKNDV